MFAYGQTGSGKTFTMSGTDEEVSLIRVRVRVSVRVRVRVRARLGLRVSVRLSDCPFRSLTYALGKTAHHLFSPNPLHLL